MPVVEIVIDVAGEAAGSPGVARSFNYSKIDPTPPLVTLSLGDVTGVISFDWSFVSQPIGAGAVLSSTTVPSPTFTPTVAVSGTYLIQCVVNGGEVTGRNALAFLTEYLSLRKPAPQETTQFSATRGWEVALSDTVDAVDVLGGVAIDARGARRRTVIDVVDCTAAPPTEVSGDRYILDTSVGVVHANWDGAVRNDVVEFNGTVWEATSPSEGWVAFVDLKNIDYRFIDDGTPIWEGITGSVSGSGNPNGVASGAIGQFYWDLTSHVLYINHDGSTGWYVV